MRNSKTPIASIKAGYQHAAAALMASTSYETGCKTLYNPAERRDHHRVADVPEYPSVPL